MLPRLLIVTFIESLATVLVERGIYFYTHEHLSFTDVMNLSVALLLGMAYVVGAMASAPVSGRIGERTLLRWAIVGQLVCHAMPLVMAPWAAVYVVAVGIGLFNGLKWPVVESYVAAGHFQRTSVRVIGLFNIAWSTSVPVALWLAGPLLTTTVGFAGLGDGVLLFVFAGSINLVSLGLLRPLPGQPAHLPDDHPDRPVARQLTSLRAMLTSSRWSMLAGVCLLFVVAPLMPTILTDRLGLTTAWAVGFSSAIDVVRVFAFVVLWRTSGWHDRATPLVVAACVTPVGFCLILTGTSLGVVLAGQVLFGLAMGLSYYAALYYAMRVKNASVDAGGAHEGLIGLGFFLGPLFGLLGTRLSQLIEGVGVGVLVGVGPMIGLCMIGALWPIVRRVGGRSDHRHQERGADGG